MQSTCPVTDNNKYRSNTDTVCAQRTNITNHSVTEMCAQQVSELPSAED